MKRSGGRGSSDRGGRGGFQQRRSASWSALSPKGGKQTARNAISSSSDVGSDSSSGSDSELSQDYRGFGKDVKRSTTPNFVLLGKAFTPENIAARDPETRDVDERIIQTVLALDMDFKPRRDVKYYYELVNGVLAHAIFILPDANLPPHSQFLQGERVKARLAEAFIPHHSSQPNVILKPSDFAKSKAWLRNNCLSRENGEMIVNKIIPDHMPVGTVAVVRVTVSSLQLTVRRAQELLTDAGVPVKLKASEGSKSGADTNSGATSNNSSLPVATTAAAVSSGLFSPSSHPFSVMPISSGKLGDASLAVVNTPASSPVLSAGLFAVTERKRKLLDLQTEGEKLDSDISAREARIAELQRRVAEVDERLAAAASKKEAELQAKRQRMEALAAEEDRLMAIVVEQDVEEKKIQLGKLAAEEAALLQALQASENMEEAQLNESVLTARFGRK